MIGSHLENEFSECLTLIVSQPSALQRLPSHHLSAGLHFCGFCDLCVTIFIRAIRVIRGQKEKIRFIRAIRGQKRGG